MANKGVKLEPQVEWKDLGHVTANGVFGKLSISTCGKQARFFPEKESMTILEIALVKDAFNCKKATVHAKGRMDSYENLYGEIWIELTDIYLEASALVGMMGIEGVGS